MTAISKTRIESIDLLKGLVMVIMALDHTRDYFHQSSNILGLTDPAQANLPLYLTRWITHFCAPAFCFLAGTSAFFVGKRKAKSALSSFLLKRGLWLVFLELTIIGFAWTFDIHFSHIFLMVIWSLGMSMITLAGLIFLPFQAILVVSLLLIFGHNLLDSIHYEGSFLWAALHEFATFSISNTRELTVVYPILPWIGVMALGYCFGQFYAKDWTSAKRRRMLNLIGISSFLVFVVLRFSNTYGEPEAWEVYETPMQTVMSFFNLTKYPPSLLFLLVTLGGSLIFLANSESWKGKIVNFFTVFGRVPFFYYILHLYLIRVLALAAAEITGHGWQLMVQHTVEIDLGSYGFSLPIIYLIWISIIAILYPFCKWYDQYKMNNREKWWLSYL